MKPYSIDKQKTGRYLDAGTLRISLASILNLDPTGIPEFFDSKIQPDSSMLGWQRLQRFLEPLGMWALELNVDAKIGDPWLKTTEGYHIRGGSKGEEDQTTYFCVGYKDKILHDPDTNGLGLSPVNGKWIVIMICNKL